MPRVRSGTRASNQAANNRSAEANSAPNTPKADHAPRATYRPTTPTTFPVGNEPKGIAYDGEHMWVTNSEDDTVSRVDTAKRQIWFRAGGVHPGPDPSHVHLCRVNFDGTGFQQLTQAAVFLQQLARKIHGRFTHAANTQENGE